MSHTLSITISIGYDTAGFFYVSSSNVPGLKMQAKSFAMIVEQATARARRILGKPYVKIAIEPGVMVRDSSP